MLESKQQVVMWLSDEWARVLLGEPESPKKTRSRWVATGSIAGVDQAQGVWLAVEKLEQWDRGDQGISRTRWAVIPRVCLFRWAGIITIQVFEGDEKDIEIGFRPEGSPGRAYS